MLVDLAEIVEEYLTGLTCNERGKMGFIGKTDISEFNASCFFEDANCKCICANFIYGALEQNHIKLATHYIKKFKFGSRIAISICIVHGNLDLIRMMLKYVDLTEEDAIECLLCAQDSDHEFLAEFFEKYYYYNYR